MTRSPFPHVVALGTFDGLHPGHRAVISACVDLAKEKGVRSLVYTFWEHPKHLFGQAPEDIITPQKKLCGILELGADELAADHFTPELSCLSPEKFVDMLAERFKPVAFVCGQDYSFGAGGKGDSKLLTEIAQARGIETLTVPLVKIKIAVGFSDQKVSSTAIRAALAEGHGEIAKKLIDGEPV